MGITLMICAEKDCGRMLNGELCSFLRGKPYCYLHDGSTRAAGAINAQTEAILNGLRV